MEINNVTTSNCTSVLLINLLLFIFKLRHEEQAVQFPDINANLFIKFIVFFCVGNTEIMH